MVCVDGETGTDLVTPLPLCAHLNEAKIRSSPLRQRHPILAGCQGQLKGPVPPNTAMAAHMSILLLLSSLLTISLSVQFHPRNPTHLPSFPITSQNAAQNVSTISSSPPAKGWIRRKAGLKPDKRNRRPRKLLLRKVKKLLPKKDQKRRFPEKVASAGVERELGANLSLADSLNKTLLLKNGARDRGSRFLSLFTVVRLVNLISPGFFYPCFSGSRTRCA